MTEARFEYKCRRCHEVFTTLQCEYEEAEKILFTSVNPGIGEGKTAFNLISMHTCNDGGGGVMDLVGFRKVDK